MRLYLNVSWFSVYSFRAGLKEGLLAIMHNFASVCCSFGVYVAMRWHQNAVFSAKRGTSKQSSVLPAPRTRSRIPVPWTGTSMCGKGSAWWGRCKEPTGWVYMEISNHVNQGQSLVSGFLAFWLHLILLSRKGSAFCSTGLNDIYWINSWMRGEGIMTRNNPFLGLYNQMFQRVKECESQSLQKNKN